MSNRLLVLPPLVSIPLQIKGTIVILNLRVYSQLHWYLPRRLKGRCGERNRGSKGVTVK
jgi:hypothetical protein